MGLMWRKKASQALTRDGRSRGAQTSVEKGRERDKFRALKGEKVKVKKRTSIMRLRLDKARAKALLEGAWGPFVRGGQKKGGWIAERSSANINRNRCIHRTLPLT